MKRITIFLLFIISLISVTAQESTNVISADRPSMAKGVDVMPFKSVQWETGFKWDYAYNSHSFTLPTTMMRVGITKNHTPISVSVLLG